VAIEGNLPDVLRDMKMFIDFKILKVKVPIFFPVRMVFWHAGIDVTTGLFSFLLKFLASPLLELPYKVLGRCSVTAATAQDQRQRRKHSWQHPT
jgi:hypothetical protein